MSDQKTAFDAWYDSYDMRTPQSPFDRELAWKAWQAAMQSQATEAFPCRIVEADFETGTVTLEMHGKYTVSSGQKYLCDAPLQSQDRKDAERYRKLVADWFDHVHGREFSLMNDLPPDSYESKANLDAAIDAAMEKQP